MLTSIYLLIQETLCTSKDNECVSKIESDDSFCLKPCSGLIVTSFTRLDANNAVQDVAAIYKTYNKYKKVTQYPSRYKGRKTGHLNILIQICLI